MLLLLFFWWVRIRVHLALYCALPSNIYQFSGIYTKQKHEEMKLTLLCLQIVMLILTALFRLADHALHVSPLTFFPVSHSKWPRTRSDAIHVSLLGAAGRAVAEPLGPCGPAAIFL